MKSHTTTIHKDGKLSEANATASPVGQHLPCDKAADQMSQEDAEDALEYHKRLIHRSPAKFHLWSRMAELVSEPELRIGLLAKALLLGREEKDLVNIRLSLASLLSERGLESAAKYELDRYAATYRDNGWRPRGEYYRLYENVRDVDPSVDNRDLYLEYAHFAEEMVYKSLPELTAVKVTDGEIDDRTHPGRKISTWCFRTRDAKIWLRNPWRFGIKVYLPDGSPASIQVSEGKIIRIVPLQEIPEGEDWLKVVSGVVQLRTDRNGRAYTKIDGVYVGARYLEGVPEGTPVRIVALRQQDARWSAIAIDLV